MAPPVFTGHFQHHEWLNFVSVAVSRVDELVSSPQSPFVATIFQLQPLAETVSHHPVPTTAIAMA